VVNIEKKYIYTLGADDDKAVQLFVKLGMPKNLAKTLLYISQFDECKCADIEHGADLRQPEVSIAMAGTTARRIASKRSRMLMIPSTISSGVRTSINSRRILRGDRCR